MVKIIDNFEAYPYVSVSVSQTSSSFSFETFLTSNDEGGNS